MHSRALLVCIVCSGCAPLADLRPASGMMEGRSHEIGAGAVHVGSRALVDESPTVSGLAWYSGAPSTRVTLSVLGAFDAHAVALGGAFRVEAVRSHAFVAAAELQGGYAWAALTFPMALRVYDESWVYTSPRIGTIGRYLGFGVPLGLSVRAYRGFMVRAEAQASFERFERYNRRIHLAGGAAYQW
ncbi:MAG: hypothetical protein ACXVEE_31140 [Polyangiales bacterium]